MSEFIITELFTSQLVQRHMAPKGLVYSIEEIHMNNATVAASTLAVSTKFLEEANVLDQFDSTIIAAFTTALLQSSQVVFKTPRRTKYISFGRTNSVAVVCNIFISGTLEVASESESIWEYIAKKM